MYYYIMEPGTGKTTAWQERVKNLLGDLGIAGETVMPSPARTIEELTTLGIVKGYSTIVAVGSIKLVNKIATALINQKENKDVVLGVIPDDFESTIAKKIQIKDIKEACDTLKYRKLQIADACFVEPNKYFLTEAVLEGKRTVDAYIITPYIKAGFPFNRIVIKPGLLLEITDSGSSSQKKGIFSWFLGKKEEKDIYSSFFKTKTFKIETVGVTTPLKVDDEIIAKTPIICHNKPKALKIIVARDIIETNK